VRTVDGAAIEANFAAVKGSISCDRVAEPETALRLVGGLLRGRCPLPDHEDRTPSFYCYPSADGFYDSWWCFGCSRGGDVVDLFAAMEGLEHNLVWAMEGLAERLGLKLWRPEDLMSETQLAVRKARRRVRRAFLDAVAEHIFERDVMPVINAVEDAGERRAFLERCLKEAGLARR